MSPKGQRRSQSNAERKNENISNDRLKEFNTDNESDSNIKYTSTPLRKIDLSLLQEQSKAPNFDSEESTDAPKVQTKPTKRRKTSRSFRKERLSSAQIIASADLAERRRRRSRRRRSDGSKNDLEGGGENEDFERLRKERTGRRQAEESAELPIAELLRRAQENQKTLQTRYEDPIPLPELTTDTLYVQGRNGFSAVKIRNLRSERSPLDRSLKPIHIAIKIHNLSKTVMFFCQGLLGGIALSQVILIARTQADTNLLPQINYPGYSQLMSGLFLFLVTMSLLAAMDRIDMAHLDVDHFREIFSHRFTMIVTCPLYMAAICIHLSAINIDQGLTTVGQEPQKYNATDYEEYPVHRQTHTWKFALCIIAWLLIALGPSDDSTTTHLEAMQKYAA